MPPKRSQSGFRAVPAAARSQVFCRKTDPSSGLQGPLSRIQTTSQWTNLTNMVWIDNPYGIGLSQGNTTVKDPIDAAHQFMGFWKNFNHVFRTQGYKIYLIGESYGGAWVSYFADELLAANDTENFNLAGIQLSDPYIGNLDVQTSSMGNPRQPPGFITDRIL